MLSQNRFHEILDGLTRLEPILVVGDAGIDKYTLGEVTRISPEAPVPVLEVHKEWMKLGLAANVSDNLNALQVKSTLCCVIGEDNNGKLFEHLLEDHGLQTWGVVQDAKRMTTFKERVVTSTQQICRVDYETKEPLLEETRQRFLKRIDELWNDHTSIIIEDYGKGLLSEDIIQELILRSNKDGKFLAVDPSRETPAKWYRGAKLLKPNRAEAQILAASLGHNTYDVAQIAKVLVEELAIEKIIITLGPEGMAMLDTTDDGKLHYIPTVAREVYDVSGAGDTAISAISACLSLGTSLEEAAWVGNCASGAVVAKRGTALVSTEELEDYFKNLVLKSDL